jgi:hypothetical protein
LYSPSTNFREYDNAYPLVVAGRADQSDHHSAVVRRPLITFSRQQEAVEEQAADSAGGVDCLAEVVERVTNAGTPGEPISVDDIVAAIGQRSFGPLIVVPGLIVLSPLSGVPGVPTLGGVAVLLIAAQMLVGRENVWLPGFIRRRHIGRERIAKAGRFLMPAARFVDRFSRRRLAWLTERGWASVIAASCLAIALLMPPLEAVPFANVLTAAAVSAFGLALVTSDGVVAGIAFLLTAASVGLLAAAFLG